MTTPKINVTPLIDVLLVLLIIFMVIAPLKPSSFQAKLPGETIQGDKPNPLSLVVSIERDMSLSVNGQKNLGNPDKPDSLIANLRSIFEQRTANQAFDERGNVVKTVFIKAPKNIDYGNVVKVIDAVKQAGAEPLALQIDYLD
jgi:biopolymer transport protein ExbD